MDTYNNITLSVLFALHYVSRQNLPVKYVFKTDSDCVVNYPLLKQYIAKLPKDNQEKLYMGRCDMGSGYNYYLATRSPTPFCRGCCWAFATSPSSDITRM